MILSYTVTAQDSSRTVKSILKGRLELSERLVKRLKYAGHIFRNDIPVYVNAVVQAGDVIKAVIDFDEQNENIAPEKIDLDIIYEDDYLIAVNKPPNMVVHPTFGHPGGTVANALVNHFMKKGGSLLVRPVNRLDRDTSGIVVFALNQYIQEKLIVQMKSGDFTKEYLGVVHGHMEEKSGAIRLPIERMPGSIMLRRVSPSGAPSVTHFEVLEYFDDATYLRFRLETGRTHQIRVHCQSIGHPLVGDTLYTGCFEVDPPDIISRQALHSSRISFSHPAEGRTLEISAPIPPDFAHALEILRK